MKHRWTKNCYEFKEIRSMIHDDDRVGIMNGILRICERYAKLPWVYAEDFDALADEIDIAIEFEEYNEEGVVDSYLAEFYDVCDNARVWLAI